MPTSADLINTTDVGSLSNKIGLLYNLISTNIGTSTDESATTSISGQANALHSLIIGNETYSVYGLNNKPQIDAFSPASVAIRDVFKTADMMVTQFGVFYERMTNHCAQYGKYVNTSIKSIDTYADYYNAATAFTVLYSWQFATAFYSWTGTGQMLAATNVLGPVATFGRGTVTGTDTATFTDMNAIGTVNTVASGVQGYSPAQIDLVVTGGTFTGTCVATGINQGGTAGRTWTTGGITNITSASGPQLLTPTVAGERTTNLTAITYVGGNTGATFELRSRGPAVA